MIQLRFFEAQHLPAHFKCQILSFMRINWFDGFQGENRLRDWITGSEMHPVHFLLEENGILISHQEVVWKPLHHAGDVYKAYGLTHLFTYPAFRGQGYGSRLLQVAKDYILQQGDADILILHTVKENLHERAGLEPMKQMITLVGDPQNPKKSNETGFMLFLSEKGKQGRKYFEEGTLYFGEETW